MYMKETIVNYSGNQREFDAIWDGYHQMTCLDFISKDTWRKFFEQCHAWYVDNEIGGIRDADTGKVIWIYTGEAEYRA